MKHRRVIIHRGSYQGARLQTVAGTEVHAVEMIHQSCIGAHAANRFQNVLVVLHLDELAGNRGGFKKFKEAGIVNVAPEYGNGFS